MYGPVSLATADVVTGEKSERTSWRLRVHRDYEDSGPDRLFRVSKREIEREREREEGWQWSWEGTWKEPKPWGLHCCNAGDYDSASVLLPLLFLSFSFSLLFHSSKFTGVVPPSRDALKVRCLVITLASCLLFKHRAFFPTICA